jgi:hypothetical protein
MICDDDLWLLFQSYKTAQKGLRDIPNVTDEVLIELTARIHNHLEDRRRAGGAIDRTLLDGLAAYIAGAWFPGARIPRRAGEPVRSL